MKLDRSTLLVLAVVFAAGWWTSSRHAPAPTPGPTDRPFLRILAKVAKNLLWVALVAEPPPQEPAQRLVHARVGRDGFQILDNGSTL